MNSDDFYKSFSGNGLIVFSDPSAAKTCLAFASILKELKPECSFDIYTNKSYPFFSDWDLKINRLDQVKEIDFQGVNWVFSGTSHPDSSACFEIALVKKALSRKIKTFAFVDQWKDVNLRFTYENQLFIPDKVLVSDSFSENKMQEQGIDGAKVSLLVNPYHDYIRFFWKASLSRENLEKQLQLSLKDKRLAIYAPDPFTLRGQDKLFGFDEFSVLQELLKIQKTKEKLILLVKLHPLQPNKEYFLDMLAGAENVYLDLEGKMDNLELISHSDLVVGFYSNFLLEAACLDKRVIRYFPKNAQLDILEYLDFGIKAKSYEDLMEALN